jgi:fructose-bisphosphate aldolase class II
MLATLNDVINAAKTEQYAIPAFNIFGYEDARACINAAETLQAPVILATNKVATDHIPIPVFGKMLVAMASEASIPVVVHLDHAPGFATIAKAIKAGYSSVMFDGSQLPLEENIAKTKEIVKLAHAFNISVEAEIGSVAYRDKYKYVKTNLTEPNEARLFVEKTGVDALAVSVGSMHRMEAQEALINFELIKEIETVVDIPLVMHGATGISDEDLEALVKTKFGKVNIGTALRMAFGNSLRKQMNQDQFVYDRMELFPEAMREVERVAIQKMLLLNADKTRFRRSD